MKILVLTELKSRGMIRMDVNPTKILGIIHQKKQCDRHHQKEEVRDMKLSTKGRYGLRAFIDLAVCGKEEPVSLTSIAARQEISLNYLEQLMAKLKKAGLVESIRGCGGGYRLAREADEISVGDVLRALEGDLTPVECVGLDSGKAIHCTGSETCVSRIVWKRINDSINETVDGIFIGELVRESEAVNKA